MSANDIVPVARRAKRRAARSHALRQTAVCVAGVAVREARERRQALAEIAALMRRNPFLDAEI